MEGSSAAVRIDRKSSIETEPRTLRLDQIQYAREAALYVLSTKSMEEALDVFLEGLEPVENASKSGDRLTECREELQNLEDGLLQAPALRDVATAPF